MDGMDLFFEGCINKATSRPRGPEAAEASAKWSQLSTSLAPLLVRAETGSGFNHLGQ